MMTKVEVVVMVVVVVLVLMLMFNGYRLKWCDLVKYRCNMNVCSGLFKCTPICHIKKTDVVTLPDSGAYNFQSINSS